jgi:hypothetical protein
MLAIPIPAGIAALRVLADPFQDRGGPAPKPDRRRRLYRRFRVRPARQCGAAAAPHRLQAGNGVRPLAPTRKVGCHDVLGARFVNVRAEVSVSAFLQANAQVVLVRLAPDRDELPTQGSRRRADERSSPDGGAVAEPMRRVFVRGLPTASLPVGRIAIRVPPTRGDSTESAGSTRPVSRGS